MENRVLWASCSESRFIPAIEGWLCLEVILQACGACPVEDPDVFGGE